MVVAAGHQNIAEEGFAHVATGSRLGMVLGPVFGIADTLERQHAPELTYIDLFEVQYIRPSGVQMPNYSPKGTQTTTHPNNMTEQRTMVVELQYEKGDTRKY